METIMTLILLATVIIGFGVFHFSKKAEESNPALPMDLDFHKRFQNRFLG